MANIVDIIVKAQDKASGKIDKVTKSLDKLALKGSKVAGSIAGVAGSVGTLAPAVAGVGALSASFASAGAGAVAFGAVATSAIGRVVDASHKVQQIQREIASDTTAQQRAKDEAKLATVMNGLNDAEKGALQSLQSFDAWWKKFTRSLEKPVFKVFNQGLKLVQNTMTALKPAIATVGNVLGGFLQKVNASFKTDQVKSFFNFINKTVGSSLSAILTSAGNLFVGFMNILKAFTPLSSSMNKGMVNLTSSFKKWTQGLANSKGFQQFISYAKQNAPLVINTIKNLAQFIGKLVTDLAPLGSAVLGIVSSFAQWLNTSPQVTATLNAVKQAGIFLKNNLDKVKLVLGLLLAGFLAFKGALVVVNIIKTFITVFRTIKTVVAIARTTFMLFNATLLANPIVLIIMAIVALIAIGVELYKHWDTVKKKAEELWAKVKSVWDNIKKKIYDAIQSIIKKVEDFKNNAIQKLKGMWDSAVKKVKDGVNHVITTIKNTFKNIDWGKIGSNIVHGIWNGIKGLGHWIGKKISGFAGDMLGWAKKALGIHSPSRVFRDQVGKFISMGIGEGIERNAYHAYRALETVKRGMLDSMSGFNRELGVGVDYFSGGRSSMTITHEVQGTVKVSGDNGNAEVVKVATQTVGTQVVETNLMSGLRQAVRKR